MRILTTVITADGGPRRRSSASTSPRQPDAVRRRIGLAGQYAAVDGNLTGRENLRLIGRLTHLGRSRSAARADELLERFGLADAADRPPRTYSGGMRRRLDLAAALVHRPPVLFLDEPTTGLDPHGRSDLWEVIEELVADGTTVLLTTQYLEEADRLADDIVRDRPRPGDRRGHADRAQGPARRARSSRSASATISPPRARRGRRTVRRARTGRASGRRRRSSRSPTAPHALVHALRALDAARARAARARPSANPASTTCSSRSPATAATATDEIGVPRPPNR